MTSEFFSLAIMIGLSCMTARCEAQSLKAQQVGTIEVSCTWRMLAPQILKRAVTPTEVEVNSSLAETLHGRGSSSTLTSIEATSYATSASNPGKSRFALGPLQTDSRLCYTLVPDAVRMAYVAMLEAALASGVELHGAKSTPYTDIQCSKDASTNKWACTQTFKIKKGNALRATEAPLVH